MFCTSCIALICIALVIHFILVDIGRLELVYSKLELYIIYAAVATYLGPTMVCVVGKFRMPCHKHILLFAMIGGGGLLYAVLGDNGEAFLLFPMFVGGMYCSESLCRKTYIHLILINIVATLFFFWMDIRQLHYYGLGWDFNVIVLNYIIPELVYITVVYLLSMYTMRSDRRFLKDLVELYERSAKKNAEIEACADVQRSAFPSDFNIAPNGEFSISAELKPAFEAAGDFYDFFITKNNHLVAVVADVSDKGLASALYMMSARNTIRSLYIYLDDPAEVVSRANAILLSTSDREFVTMFLLDVDIKSGKAEFVNAGHNPPVLRRVSGETAPVSSEPQTIMGVFENARYFSTLLNFEKGDTLCMYTDGITDAVNSNGESYGIERLMGVVKKTGSNSPETVKNAILEDVERYEDTSLFSDDKTLTVLRWN